RVQLLLGGRLHGDLLAAPEQDQVGAFRGSHLEGARDRLEHRGGGPHVAALFQPRVPGGTDPGELCDLLAPQARRAAAAARAQPDVLGTDRLAPRAEKVCELGAARDAVACVKRRAVVPVRRFLGGLDWCFRYQDKSLSCTRIEMFADSPTKRKPELRK